jgi:hypothetical protein
VSLVRLHPGVIFPVQRLDVAGMVFREVSVIEVREAELEACRGQIAAWVEAGVPVVKIGILLSRQGAVVAERTLHRFAAGR